MRARYTPTLPTISTRRQHLRQLGSMLTCLGACPAAWALTGGSGPQDPAPQSAWAGVGSLDCGRGLFSAIPIDRQHVVTAAHVVAGVDPTRISFRLAINGGFGSGAASLHLHPDFRGMVAHNPPADPTVHDDLAIIRLAQPLPPTVPIPPIFTGKLQGSTLLLISHGGSTTLISMGENMAEVVMPDSAGRAATYMFDFDGPDLSSNRFGRPLPINGTLGAQREAALVVGDSGSAAFVHRDGRWWLAGVNGFRISFGMARESNDFGVTGGGTVLAPHIDWIRSVTSAG